MCAASFAAAPSALFLFMAVESFLRPSALQVHQGGKGSCIPPVDIRELASSCLKFKRGIPDDVTAPPPAPRPRPRVTRTNTKSKRSQLSLSKFQGRPGVCSSACSLSFRCKSSSHFNLHVYQRLTFSSASASITSPHRF